MPQLIETHLAQLAVLFVSYSMITTGLLTVFIWDTLVFDKRDAMVLGPLPLRGSTIVGAKLAALATFLVGTALAVNVTSGLPFAFVTGGPKVTSFNTLPVISRARLAARYSCFPRLSSSEDCSCFWSARSSRQRRALSAVRVSQRSALLHDGADGDGRSHAANLVVRGTV